MGHDESLALTGPPGQGLPVWRITARSYAFLWQEWRILALPILSLILLMAVIPDPHLDNLPMLLIALSPSALFMPAFEVGLFRRLLLGEPRRHFTLFCLTRALITYSIAGIKLVLCLALAWVPAMILGIQSLFETMEDNPSGSLQTEFYAGILVSALATLLLVRLELILPAAAIGGPLTFRQSWTGTKNNGMRVAAITALTMGPFFLIPAIPPFDLVPLLAVILQAVAVPIRVVAVSLTYQALARSAKPSNTESAPS